MGIVTCRDAGGFCVDLVAVRLTVASLPYLTAGVSSSPGLVKLVGECNLGPGRSVLGSTPGGTLSSRGPYKTHHGFFTNYTPPPGLFTIGSSNSPSSFHDSEFPRRVLLGFSVMQ